MDKLPVTEFQQADGVEDWRVVNGGASAWFDAPSLTSGAEFVSRIAELGERDTLPDVDLRPGGVRVRIGAQSSGDLTAADAAFARAISAAGRELGLTGDPAALQTVQLAIDSDDLPSLVSFWRTLFDYEVTGTDGLEDRFHRDPSISFHRLETPRPLRNRIHIDVVRAPEAVATVKSAVGREAYGAYQVTLADAEGNEIDLIPGDDLSQRPDTADWRALFAATTFYPTASPVQASELVRAVARLADDAGLPILVDLRANGVMIDSGKDQWEEHAGGTRFVDLARRIQSVAHEVGLSADTTRLRFVQLGIDAVDVPAVRAFWTTVLGYHNDPRAQVTDIYDPRRLNPEIIFQEMDALEEDRRRQRNRIHLDLVIPYDQAKARIDATVAAGGRIVDDKTTGHCMLADPEGNEVDIVARA